MEFEGFREIEINETAEYEKFSEAFDTYREFFEDLSGLISFNGQLISLITDKHHYFLDTSLIDNAAKTLKSIKTCCSCGSFADANTLIRKLRDDLFLYIYIIDVINRRIPFTGESLQSFNPENPEAFVESLSKLAFNNILTADEQAVEAWMGNSVSTLPARIKRRLRFENYMKFLRINATVDQVLTTHNLEEYWENLRIKLNNYVDNNGISLTRQNVVQVGDRNLEVYLKEIINNTSYISSLFVVLLLMVKSSLISSSDLINYLDCDIEPPDGRQYTIAPFVQDFIDSHVVRLHPELKQFLTENNVNGMRIE